MQATAHAPETPPSAYALIEARATACRAHPFWPFGTLTPQQQRRRDAQQEAMRAGMLARYPAGLL